MAENQSLGEIIPRDDADQQFGTAGISKSISTNQLLKFAGMTNHLLMFNIVEENLIIMGDGRKILSPEGYTSEQETVYKVYSKTKVLELIETGGAQDNYIEFRGDTLTITNGDSTLEFGSLCPPICESA